MAEDRKNLGLDIDIAQLFESQKEDIKQKALEALKERITENIRWTMGDVIGEQVKEFVKTEISPEIEKMLMENKQLFLDQIMELAKSLGSEVAKALVLKAQENLANSWDVKKIGEALFN